MKFDILTIFPHLFDSVFEETIIKKARERGVIEVGIHDIREYARDRHRVTDDLPYGGGPGMVMKAEPIISAVEDVWNRNGKGKVILLTPSGTPLTSFVARDLSRETHLIIVCGRYEGIDERVGDYLGASEVSIGDYVLTGGEIPAMVIVDAVSRFVPGVVGDAESVIDDSFEMGFLEGPHYTRPEEVRGIKVPHVLLSGNHRKIREFRMREGLKKTLKMRPDLLEGKKITGEIKRYLDEIKGKDSPGDGGT